MLSLWDKTQIVAHYAQGALAWLRHDTRYPSPVADNPLFRSAWDATGLIPNGATVGVSGLGGHQRASILYWAIRERFEKLARPRALTIVNVGGHGGRGAAPGTLEELGQRGLCTRFITGHFETYHAMLHLAEAGVCELQCIPLGVMTLLFAAMARGHDSLLSRVGIGTFLDPRVGRGSPLANGEQLVRVERGRLRYRLPKIDVALFNLPAADTRGNLYADGAAVVCESRELARAAKRNGGLVLANVGRLVPFASGEVFLDAKDVDAIVYHPDTEQTFGIPHRQPWQALTPSSDEAMDDGLERVRFVNAAAASITGRLRQRSTADLALARVAAATLLSVTAKGARVAIGTGLPEEIPAVVFDGGALKRVQFLVESGVVGGLPLSGLFFGAALRPQEIVSSSEIFRRCQQGLDAACLGALEVDSAGNVNVSKRDHGVHDYVGPGGFMDFCTAADCIIFICSWMRGGELEFDGRQMHVRRHGEPKFVASVGEITFHGQLGLRSGKRLLYVTHAGIFELGKEGLQLRYVMPGIDVQRDITSFSRARILLPSRQRIPSVPATILAGRRLARFLPPR